MKSFFVLLYNNVKSLFKKESKSNCINIESNKVVLKEEKSFFSKKDTILIPKIEYYYNVMGKNTFGIRPTNIIIDTLVIHYISAINTCPDNMFSIDECIKILNEYEYSAHVIIDREGIIYKLIDYSYRAYHSGKSLMPYPDNRENVNNFSIGVELIATAKSGFTDEQYHTLNWLIENDIHGNAYKVNKFVGHEDISGDRAVEKGIRTKENKKVDPGEFFDWKRLKYIHFGK